MKRLAKPAHNGRDNAVKWQLDWGADMTIRERIHNVTQPGWTKHLGTIRSPCS